MRATYRQIAGPDGLLAKRLPFNGNSMSAQIERKDYVVYSYGTEIARAWRNGPVVYVNEDTYSVTTSKHQRHVRLWLKDVAN